MIRSFLLLGLFVFPAMSHAIEEPDYQVVERIGAVEIRQYAAYAVAEVQVSGPADQAGNEGFRLLAAYIFGKNRGERKLAMTAPVTQTPIKLEMTAPVTQTPEAGGYRVQFVLPKGVTAATAPEPIDPRVQLREVPARRWAVLRFSGFWSESNYTEHLNALQLALRESNTAWTGEPVYSRYDAPWNPWFLRRNEIWLRVGPP